jgi:hypothetical protein
MTRIESEVYERVKNERCRMIVYGRKMKDVIREQSDLFKQKITADRARLGLI